MVGKWQSGEVQSTGTITLPLFFSELLPLVFYMVNFCPKHITKTIRDIDFILSVVDKWQSGEVQGARTITLPLLFSELLPLVYLHHKFLSGAYLQNRM